MNKEYNLVNYKDNKGKENLNQNEKSLKKAYKDLASLMNFKIFRNISYLISWEFSLSSKSQIKRK